MIIHRPTLNSGLRRLGRGFTLIEVILAMVVLTLVMGAVFTMLQSTTKAAMEIQKREIENAEITALRELFRKTFGALPSGAELSLELLEGGEPLIQELTIAGVPEAFAHGIQTASEEDKVFGIQVDVSEDGVLSAQPTYTFAYTREDLIPEDQTGLVVTENGKTLVAPDNDGRYWFPLVRNVSFLQWHFYNEEEETWEEEWDDGDPPPLIQLEIRMGDRQIPHRFVFPVVTGDDLTS